MVRAHLVGSGVALRGNAKSKCQPSHRHDSPVFSASPAASQGADDGFAKVNPCHRRSGVAGARAAACVGPGEGG